MTLEPAGDRDVRGDPRVGLMSSTVVIRVINMAVSVARLRRMAADRDASGPLYPRKQTLSGYTRRSVSCQ
jgi:hypothetical protein